MQLAAPRTLQSSLNPQSKRHSAKRFTRLVALIDGRIGFKTAERSCSNPPVGGLMQTTFQHDGKIICERSADVWPDKKLIPDYIELPDSAIDQQLFDREHLEPHAVHICGRTGAVDHRFLPRGTVDDADHVASLISSLEDHGD